MGDVIKVDALFDAATGRYGATRVERNSGVTAYALRGPVSRLDPAAETFDIDTERISYATFAGALPAGLANRAPVRVRLQTAQVGGAWVVFRIGDGVQRPPAGEQVRLDGRVSAVVSATRFSVEGLAVNTGARKTAGVVLGVRVEIERAASGDTVVAAKLKVKSEGEPQAPDVELRGSVAAPNSAASSFVVRGVTATYSGASAEFRNDTAAGLANGANVEVRGKLSANGTQFTATPITFR